MVWIPPGTFKMGGAMDPTGRSSPAGLERNVTLTRGFWLGGHEVRQGEWEAVMGSNPSFFKGHPDLPVERVSWEEAVEYGRELTERERAAGRLPAGHAYALPTEAQWEFACRAGTTTTYSFGDHEPDLDRHGWHLGNSGGRTHPVGTLQPNPWGLHDLHGNVWEWCADGWVDRLPGGSVTDPTGPARSSFRVMRGGAWDIGARFCRSADRHGLPPSARAGNLGFRIALVPLP